MADRWTTFLSVLDGTTHRNLVYHHEKDEARGVVAAVATREGDLPRFGPEQAGRRGQRRMASYDPKVSLAVDAVPSEVGCDAEFEGDIPSRIGY